MPVHARSCSSRATQGFTLVELVVTAILVGLLATGALTYFRGVADDSRLGIASEELARIRDEIQAWTLVPGRKAPRSFLDLPRLGGQTPADPWNQLYVIQPDQHRVLSSGPNGVLETGVTDAKAVGDDLAVEYIPPVKPGGG